MITVLVKKLHPAAQLPTFGTHWSAGADLYAVEETELWSGKIHVVNTGVAIELPPGYEGQIRPRSSLSKNGIRAAFGTIDSDYRGEVGVILQFLGQVGRYVIHEGERIAQLVVNKIPAVEFAFVDTLGHTARGEGGFGSTGR